jgi:hypothetical protein
MSIHTSNQLYHAYLLRLWSANERGKVVWRASLENPQTGERLGFANLERLFGFLQDQTMKLSGDEAERPSSLEQ